MAPSATPAPKKLLYEVSIIRPIVIGLLVLLHAFTNFYNSGFNISSSAVGCYRWFSYIISGFRIETIALIAGYVFAFQSLDLGKRYSFGPFLVKKFKRLIIPMLFFGMLYYFLILFDRDTFTFSDFFMQLFTGCGHLWFLPMLFWCFIAIWIIDHYKLSSWITLLLLAAFTFIHPSSLPFGFARLPYFLFFVYGGYFLWIHHDQLQKRCTGVPVIISLWVVYLLLVVVRYQFLSGVFNGSGTLQRIMEYLVRNGLALLISCVGIMALYLTVCRFTTRPSFVPRPVVIRASDYCYGIYVYHQFVMLPLFFNTPIIYSCNSWIMPWVAFLLTYIISLILTILTLKTKFGRSLIG